MCFLYGVGEIGGAEELRIYWSWLPDSMCCCFVYIVFEIEIPCSENGRFLVAASKEYVSLFLGGGFDFFISDFQVLLGLLLSLIIY